MSNIDIADELQAHELPEEMQRNLLLTYLTSHKMTYIQEFLKARGLPYSYRKPEFPGKLTEYVTANKLQISDLVALLNTIEGWGKQHIYLYRAPGALSTKWRDDPTYVRHQLEAAGAGYSDLLNRSRPLILPTEPTLSTIETTQERVRFVWVDRRTWFVRVPGQDRVQTQADSDDANGFRFHQMVWHAFQVKMARGLIVFEWNLNTHDAMLLIQQLPSGRRNYKAVRDEFEGYLRGFFDVDSFEKVRVSSGLTAIEASGEIRRQHMTFRSLHNRGRISVTSPQKDQDVFDDDTVIRRARAALGVDATGLLGNFYWIPITNALTVELYTQLYGEDDDDQRIGILAEHVEADVRYVLSRIRNYCV